MKKNIFGALALTAAVGVSAAVVFAQDLPPDAQGPSEAQIAAFEQEQGAPLEAFNAAPPEMPTIEEPQAVPDEVKALVPEKDVLELYCLMTRWKSGSFLAAMDALKKHLVPAVEKARAMGIDMSVPDTDGMRAEGQRRIDGICAAKTVADAERMAQEFAQWGRDQAASGMQNQRGDLEAKMRAQGDALRAKVREALQPLIAEETAKLQSEIQLKAQAYAEEILAPYRTGEGGAPPSEASVRAQVEDRLRPFIEQKKAEIEKKLRAKADEIIAPEKKKFDEISALFQGLDKKINDAIAAGDGKSAEFRKKAIALRKILILKLFDTNLGAATQALDGAAEQIDEARKADPSLPSAANLKAELAQDRKNLEVKLTRAIDAEDEYALEQAFNEFRDKWERVQERAAKAASEAVTKICSTATAQFSAARAQLDSGIAKIQDIQARCAGQSTDDCLEVQKFGDRMTTVANKMTDVRNEMAAAEAMCAAGTPDAERLVALLQKIQADGEAVRAYGDALDADKSNVLVDSVQAACIQALPQLDAAKLELSRDDLTALGSTLARCRGKTTPECVSVLALEGKYNDVKQQVDEYKADIDKAGALCRSVKNNDADFEKILSTLSDLGARGDDLQEAAKDLRAEQVEKASGRAYCRAVTEKLRFASKDAAALLAELSGIERSCSGKKTPRCNVIVAAGKDIAAVRTRTKGVLEKVSQVDALCKNAGAAPPDASLTGLVDETAVEGVAARADGDALRAKLDRGGQSGGGILVEAENETASYILPKANRPAPNMKETNPPWRPPYYGSGDWYLAAGGEWLSYNLAIPSAGTYQVWVRDYIDRFQAAGVRRFIVEFDGKRYGVFREVDASAPGNKGIFGWHKVGSGISLTAGAHVMKITKEATTAGAAIMDAFYLTTGSEVPPEK